MPRHRHHHHHDCEQFDIIFFYFVIIALKHVLSHKHFENISTFHTENDIISDVLVLPFNFIILGNFLMIHFSILAGEFVISEFLLSCSECK